MTALEIPTWYKGVVVAFAIVDQEDRELAELRWRLSSSGYAQRDHRVGKDKWRALLMHRKILGLDYQDPSECDHINGNKLDNRRNNLRVVTDLQNSQNRSARCDAKSQLRGVSWDSRAQTWRARAMIAGESFSLGSYKDKFEASEAVSAFRLERMSHTNELRRQRTAA